MRQRPRSLVQLFLLLFIFGAFGGVSFAQRNKPRSMNQTAPRDNAPAATTSQAAPDISFNVSLPQPHTHLIEVEMRVQARNGARLPASIDLLMPVWTPGSYLVREYARQVQDFEAQDAASAGVSRLSWSKINKNTWRIQTRRDDSAASATASAVRVFYRVYANEFSVRTNEVNEQHAFWNNAATLMYVDKLLSAPSTLRVTLPRADWKIATGLPAVPDQPNTFRAENFDILYDSPVLASDFKLLTFEVDGKQHRIAIDGEGNYDAERIKRDTQKIVEQGMKMFGELPYRDYTFLLMLHPTAGGGLEHLNSTALIFRRHNFRAETSYRSLLELTAHEYFHLWNVKRIRPDALGPFNYTAENYTKLLWVAEGLTSYYESLLLRRAGLTSDKDFLSGQATAMQTLQNVPGRLEQSLEESSFDAWIKYYRQDENSPNSQVSYYDKGALVGLLLDLEIRRRTDGAKSLDDVMRTLYTDFAKRNRNYTPEDFQRVSEGAAGGKLDDFFRRYVRGTDELQFAEALQPFGLSLTTTDPAKPAEKPFLGAVLTQNGERLIISGVRVGTPAYDQGLNANDEIVAVDGVRAPVVTNVRAMRDFLNARIDEKRPGDTVRLTVFRNENLRTFDIKLGGRVEPSYRITPVKDATAAQMKLYTGWLAAEFPQSTPRAADED